MHLIMQTAPADDGGIGYMIVPSIRMCRVQETPGAHGYKEIWITTENMPGEACFALQSPLGWMTQGQDRCFDSFSLTDGAIQVQRTAGADQSG